MRTTSRLIVALAILSLIGAACGGEPDTAEAPSNQEPQQGGTLVAAMESDVDDAFDPQKEYYSVTWGFYHCCLLRTLLTTPIATSENGGNELQPDLATDLPEISEDGLTYTFTIQDGVTFGPPFQNEPITADSFINAMEREADPAVGAGYPFYYSVIEGFDDFAAGDADTITGMTAVDDQTLEITLSRPAGDFPFRMMMPAAAPIPEGAAEGHEEDYGRFLVSSGPYMFEGSEAMDFSAPPAEQTPAAGYVPARSIVMVRNPSWSADTDPLRPAYVERIEIQIGLTTEDMQNRIAAGELDLNLDGVPPAQVIQQYQTDPERQDQIGSFVGDGSYYLSLNMAEPPFDDIHVRKAVNLGLDKQGMLQIRGGPLFGEVAGHLIIDNMLDNQLADYDPYATPNGSGDIEAAQAEMAQSQYDTNADGVCDAPECQGILTVTDEADPYPDQMALIQQNFGELGLTLDTTSFERTTAFDECEDPANHVALCAHTGWFKDYSDATTFGEPLFGSAAIGPESCCNYGLVGASPELLRENGYETTEVPNVDEEIAACDALPVGDDRFTCWSDLDRTLMEDVVPWVPINFARDVFVWGDRVQNFVYDQFSGQPGLSVMGVGGAA